MINITSFFWKLIYLIVHLEISDLRETEEYGQMCEYVNSNETFFIDLDNGYQFVTDDVSDLFNETHRFYKMYNKTDKKELITSAVKKIENYIDTEQEIDHLFDNFKF